MYISVWYQLACTQARLTITEPATVITQMAVLSEDFEHAILLIVCDQICHLCNSNYGSAQITTPPNREFTCMHNNVILQTGSRDLGHAKLMYSFSLASQTHFFFLCGRWQKAHTKISVARETSTVCLQGFFKMHAGRRSFFIFHY